MKQLDHEDRERYRKIAAVRSSSTTFAAGAEEAYAERDGKSAGTIGAVFHREAELLGDAEANLDQARAERLRAWTAAQCTARDRREAYAALRGTVCAARRFGASQTGVATGRNFGLKGPTPRHPEKLASCSRTLSRGLREARLSDAARPLAEAFAAEIDHRVEVLESALEQAELDKGRLALAHRQLRIVRRRVDAELSSSVRFLRTTLERVGLEELGVRVLGRRRGRPRKSVRARRQDQETLPQEKGAAHKRRVGEETTSAGASAELREIEGAASAASSARRKSEDASSKDFAAPRKNEDGPSQAEAELQKIGGGPCKDLPDGGQALSFQTDTTRAKRRRRRRIGESILGAPVRWLSSGVGRWISSERRSSRAMD